MSIAFDITDDTLPIASLISLSVLGPFIFLIRITLIFVRVDTRIPPTNFLGYLFFEDVSYILAVFDC